MPAPIVLSTLTPETKRVPNPPEGQPVIATKAEFRDGTRNVTTPPTTGSSNWLSHSQVSRAPAPLLRFTDLINGPATGLGDGLGSGVIVTIWAQGVGDSQGTGQVYFTDFAGTKRPAEHVYYWKRADGELPSGPARLWYSHLMQEIAFSIPAGSVDGLGEITVETSGNTSNALPFTVRAGNIYHFKSTGSGAGDGSFSSPYLEINKAVRTQATDNHLLPAGSTVYIHDVDTGSESGVEGIYWNNGAADSSSGSAHFSFIAYPGFHPKVTAQRGIEGYTAGGLITSKLDVYSSDFTGVNENDQPQSPRIDSKGTWGIKSSKNGRCIANRITDIPGMCASRYQGAIVGGGRYEVSNYRIYGNEVYDYGCYGSSKLHHTTYMSIRGAPDNPLVDPWEFQFNFLHGNRAKGGIHNFDQDANCGQTTGPIIICNNVVVEQAGAGISVGVSGGPWAMDFYIENNVLIDVGRAAAWDGVDLETVDGPEPGGIAFRDSGLTGTHYTRNNLIHGWGLDGGERGANGALVFNGSLDLITVLWDDNVAFSPIDIEFFETGFRAEEKADNATGGNNAWYYDGGGTPSRAIPPSWDTGQITTAPQISLDGAIVTVAQGSPLQSGTSLQTYDIYGVPRPATATIGPVEATA